MKRPTILIILFLFLMGKSIGQTSYYGDCDYAYPITTGYYDAPFYSIPDQLDTLEINQIMSCISTGELQGHWFEFWTLDTGSICFNIIPYNHTTDYDWALFDITGHTCFEIRSNASLEVRCNFSNSVTNNGITGANGGSNNQDEPTLHVDSGHVYKLYLHNFNQSTYGFQLDFSCSTPVLNPAVGIENQTLGSPIKIGPNPTMDLLNIYINQTMVSQVKSILLADAYGKVMIPSPQNFYSSMVMDLTNLASGLYFLKVLTDQTEISYKVIRQ